MQEYGIGFDFVESRCGRVRKPIVDARRGAMMRAGRSFERVGIDRLALVVRSLAQVKQRLLFFATTDQ